MPEIGGVILFAGPNLSYRELSLVGDCVARLLVDPGNEVKFRPILQIASRSKLSYAPTPNELRCANTPNIALLYTTDPAIAGYNVKKKDPSRVTHLVGHGEIH